MNSQDKIIKCRRRKTILWKFNYRLSAINYLSTSEKLLVIGSNEFPIKLFHNSNFVVLYYINNSAITVVAIGKYLISANLEYEIKNKTRTKAVCNRISMNKISCKSYST
jgi:hypothetical protein